MDVETTRFGIVEVEEKRIVSFPAGLLGFAAYKNYAVLEPDPRGAFLWLQALDAPELAFVVTDPRLWVPEYEVPIRREQLAELGLGSLEGAHVLAIVNKYEHALTANLQGPLVINVETQRGMQLVLADKRWTTRHEIARLPAEVHAASA